MPLDIDKLLSTPAELTDNSTAKCPVVLMTRIRLARNLSTHCFPGRADDGERKEIFNRCREAIMATSSMKRGMSVAVDELAPLQRQVLVERHLISRELSAAKSGAGAAINKDQSVSVMINEEDHLRIQVLRNGFQLKRTWTAINALDTALESSLDYAFSPRLGYVTACPTNLGTGMRASAMMHLPALVIAGQMEKVVRAVNQLGMVVRGLFGEGSDASGSMFQISNQTTLGESEPDIVKRLHNVLQSIVDHELNARAKLLETDPAKLPDKIGRAYGILKHGHVISSSEAMNLLSLVRLGVDLGYLPDEYRTVVDRLFIEAQPGHILHRADKPKLESDERDRLRADLLRSEFANFPTPGYPTAGNN
ncbi:protein arginine kinase [Actomonas aquatica]|uniref:Protein arginine kinase n=1 Tax=Actomonas aquatica TaxID=2866162 RepID=A0ABZ1C9F3_9BACT|nr:protein arginine kinase [Opitutus sp. WL0086]WRQ88146.1 protein arginine kinase [Opitutus sp. WL0086]